MLKCRSACSSPCADQSRWLTEWFFSLPFISRHEAEEYQLHIHEWSREFRERLNKVESGACLEDLRREAEPKI